MNRKDLLSHKCRYRPHPCLTSMDSGMVAGSDSNRVMRSHRMLMSLRRIKPTKTRKETGTSDSVKGKSNLTSSYPVCRPPSLLQRASRMDREPRQGPSISEPPCQATFHLGGGVHPHTGGSRPIKLLKSYGLGRFQPQRRGREPWRGSHEELSWVNRGSVNTLGEIMAYPLASKSSK